MMEMRLHILTRMEIKFIINRITMKRYNRYILNFVALSSLVATLWSCQKSEVEALPDPTKSDIITFSVGVGSVVDSRSNDVSEASQITNFGVSAYSDNRSVDALFDNEEVSYSGVAYSYDGDGRYIIDKETIRFFAYSPYNSESGAAVNSETDSFSLSYDMSDRADDAGEDLLLATTENGDNNVELQFSHAMSALKFEVKGNPMYEVKGINITGVNTAATVSLDTDGTISWDGHSTSSDEPSFSAFILSKPYVELIKDSYQAISDGYTLMIPQTLPSTACIEVLLTYADANTEAYDFTATLSIEGDVWQANKVHTYQLDIDYFKVTGFLATINDWDSDEISHSTSEGTEVGAQYWINLDDYSSASDFGTAVAAINSEADLTTLVVMGTNPTWSIGGSNSGLNKSSATTFDLSRVKGLTTISKETFYRNSTIKEIILPNTVKEVGESAFEKCTSLESINLPIVETIREHAFDDNTSLTSLSLPEVTTIEGYAFYSCNSLKSIDLPKVESVDTYMFTYCYELESIELPEVTSLISSGMFAECKKLKYVDFPKVTTLYCMAFNDCTSLESVNLPLVTSIMTYNGVYTSDLFKTSSATLKTVNLASMTSIDDGVLSSCTALEDVNLSSLTSIGDGVFSNCTSTLKTLNLSSVTSIADAVLSSCTALEDVNLASLTSVGDGVFGNCTSTLKTLSLSSVTSIDEAVLSSCTALEDVNLASLTAFTDSQTPYSLFESSRETLTTLNLASLTALPDYSFSVTTYGTNYSFSAIVSIDLSSAKSIGEYAFYYCSSLTSIICPEVTEVEKYSFSNCKKLTSISIQNLTKIGNAAFQTCSSLTSVDFPLVEIIGTNTFQSCSNLKRINLPAVTSVNYFAFSGLADGAEIYLTTTDPVVTIILRSYETWETYTIYKRENTEFELKLSDPITLETTDYELSYLDDIVKIVD